MIIFEAPPPFSLYFSPPLSPSLTSEERGGSRIAIKLAFVPASFPLLPFPSFFLLL